MIRLTREVRFSLRPGGADDPVTNSWGGWPSATAISPWMVFRCTLAGQIDPVSGYLCNIKRIDDSLRQKVIGPACETFAGMTAESLTQFAYHQIKDDFHDKCRVEQLQLAATESLEYTLHCETPDMIQLTQQFEFSASHRLHNPDLSDEENRQLFGKCNNPHGHGHNYLLKVTVEGSPGDNGRLVPLEAFESLVKRQVIDRLDHRNLNVEVEQFGELNPSVENIAVVIWDMLQEPVATLGEGQARLACVRVYETPKTWADYFGK